MERLTKNDVKLGFVDSSTLPSYASLYERLREYEIAEEQGLLLRLPCKVGDIVYQIHALPKSNRKVLVEVIADKFFITLCTLEKRFGKTVFLTKEEAEMKGE